MIFHFYLKTKLGTLLLTMKYSFPVIRCPLNHHSFTQIEHFPFLPFISMSPQNDTSGSVWECSQTVCT